MELANRGSWGEHPEIQAWLVDARLDPFAKTASERLGRDVEATEHLGRYLEFLEPAAANLEHLLAA